MSKQPTIAELTQRALRTTSIAPDQSHGDVEPHDASYGFRVDPLTAWADTKAVFKLAGISSSASTPPEWGTFVAAANSLAVPMAAGFFPQQIQDIQPLLDTPKLSQLRPSGHNATNFPGLGAWVKKHQDDSDAGTRLLATGIACQLSMTTRTDLNGNEQAATLWQSGKVEEAIECWKKLSTSPVTSFNLGMALLFTDQAAEAIPHLQQAKKQLPDDSGWSHLAQLYLSIAEMRK